MNPNSIWLGFLFTKGGNLDTEIWIEGRQWEDTGRTQPTSQGYQTLGQKHRTHFPSQSAEGVNPADILILDCEKICFRWWSDPVRGPLWRQPQLTNTGTILWLKPSESEEISGFLLKQLGKRWSLFLRNCEKVRCSFRDCQVDRPCPIPKAAHLGRAEIVRERCAPDDIVWGTGLRHLK